MSKVSFLMKTRMTISTKLYSSFGALFASSAFIGVYALMNLNAGTTARWIISCVLILGLLISAAVVWIIREISGSLRQIVSGLSQNGDQVAAASSQIAATSQSLSQGSSEQA